MPTLSEVPMHNGVWKIHQAFFVGVKRHSYCAISVMNSMNLSIHNVELISPF